jgi:hypothetical protein
VLLGENLFFSFKLISIAVFSREEGKRLKNIAN